MIKTLLTTMLISGLSVLPHQPASAQTWQVYILAGQSNMEGLGLTSDLPDSLLTPPDHVMIYHPNRSLDNVPTDDSGFWDVLRPGHGSGYAVAGNTPSFSDKFGPELTFAHHMLQLQPDANIALFKYARGGSALHTAAAGEWGHWDPGYSDGEGINQWDHFEYHFKKAISVQDIDGDGRPDTLVPAGILWLQGESDASHSRQIAEAYLGNLQNLTGRMRELAGNPDLPVVVGRISTSPEAERGEIMPWATIIQKAQQEFSVTDPHAGIIHAPDGHGWLDPWHYDSATYLDLGRRFARAMYELQHHQRHEK